MGSFETVVLVFMSLSAAVGYLADVISAARSSSMFNDFFAKQ